MIIHYYFIEIIFTNYLKDRENMLLAIDVILNKALLIFSWSYRVLFDDKIRTIIRTSIIR